jgi:hypothetical protein
MPQRRIFQPDRYGLVFLLLLADLVVLVLITNDLLGVLLQLLFVAATLLITLRVSVAPSRTVYAGRALTLVAVFSMVAFNFAGVSPELYSGITYLLLACLLILAAPSILIRIFHHDRVDFQTILGAVCFYVLLGMIFAVIYMVVNAFNGSPFFAQGPTKDPADYLYFSYVTMTTTGFGDLTPAVGIPRAFVMLEALLGQVFLVTGVAWLVSAYGRERKKPTDTQ